MLRVPGLTPELESLVRPLAKEARTRSGVAATEPSPSPTAAPVGPTASGVEAPVEKKQAAVSVSGSVSGGGNSGPGGAVVFLKRLDGTSPKPSAGKVRVILQKDKRFVPRVLVVPLGATVEFHNEDPLFHNVFSLSKPNDFDLGLYKGGTGKNQIFNATGAVQVLCNIHSSMIGWVYVVDSAWFGQADGEGHFSIKGVPPGEYVVSVWHEYASKLSTKKLHVGEAGETVALAIDADKSAPAFVPDKSGKPRQVQLGY